MTRPACLPPNVRNLQINYTALSMVAPEKNHFRYMLEGQDSEWQEVGNKREGAILQPLAGQLPVPRAGEQQQRPVERSGRCARLLDRAGVLPDELVRALVVAVCSPCCGLATSSRAASRTISST